MKEYFPHDANARSDERLLELRAEHGREGYGTWWLLVEHLREASGYRLSNAKLGGLAMGIGASVSEVRAFIDYCLGLGLLETEEEGAYFYSPALRRRMQPLDAKRLALAEAGKRGASKRWAPESPANGQPEALPQQPHADPNSQAIATPLATPMASRVEESKEETTSSLRSEVGGGEGQDQPGKDFAFESPSEAPASAPHTRGAADVPTQVAKPAGIQLTTAAYFAWFEGRYHAKPDFTSRDGKAAKELHAYFKAQADEPTDEAAAALLAQLLARWDTYDAFYQKQTALHQIRTNITNLVAARAQSTTASPQRHAIPRSSPQSNPYGAAARLHTTTPDASVGWGY